MTKKTKIELNRAGALADIDDELDDALAKLQETTSKVHEILSAEETEPQMTLETGSTGVEARPDDTEKADDETG